MQQQLALDVDKGEFREVRDIGSVASARGCGQVRVSPQDGVGRLILSNETFRTIEREIGEI